MKKEYIMPEMIIRRVILEGLLPIVYLLIILRNPVMMETGASLTLNRKKETACGQMMCGKIN